MLKPFLRRHLPALAVLLLLALACYNQLALQNRVLVGYDVLTYFYPNASYAAESLSAGRLPLWNPYLFTGVPFLANPQTGIFYPPNLLSLILPVPQALSYNLVLHVFLAGAFCYAFGLVTLHLARPAALLVGITYAFSGYFTALAGHPNQLQSSAWLPLLFLMADVAYRRRHVWLALAGAFALALQFLAGHMQVFYLSMVALGLFMAWRAGQDLLRQSNDILARKGGLRRNGPFSLALANPSVIGHTCRSLFFPLTMLVLGIALTAAQFLPTFELTGESIRAGGLSFHDAASFSLPPWMLLRSLLPAYGDPQPFSEWVGYAGVGTIFLALFAVLHPRRHGDTFYFAALASIALLLALGQFNPIYPLLHRFVPGLNLFRVPARWLLPYTFAIATLAGLGLQVLLASARPVTFRHALGRVAIAFLVLVTALGGLAVALNPTSDAALPSFATAGLWALAFVCAIAILRYGLGAKAVLHAGRRDQASVAPAAPGPAVNRHPRFISLLVLTLVSAELLLASAGMDINRVNLPEAATTLRPAVAHLAAQPGLFRVLPFSEGAFDPGDLADLKAMLAPALPPDGVYDYVVAAKHKDTLTPNLPLLFRIPSLDGYDGGVLPLRRYVEWKRVLPLATANTPDGRLREQLIGLPGDEVLASLNVKYALTDRVHDVWIDGVYYDLGLTRAVRRGGTLDLDDIPPLEATSVGIVSRLSGAASLPEGALVANLSLATASGATYQVPLRAGTDTAEGQYAEGKVAHQQARKAKGVRGEADTWDYISIVELPAPDRVMEIRLAGQSAEGELLLRAVSLVDHRRQLSYPVVVDADLRLDYLGDVKIYEHQRVQQRAFLLHQARVLSDDAAVLAAMRDPGFHATREVILTAGEAIKAGGQLAAAATTGLGAAGGVDIGARTGAPNAPSDDRGDEVDILEYSAERIRVQTSSQSAALLLLTDSYYPGWQLTVDGSPAPLLRADHLFRAVALPAGKHEVVFVYEPASLRLGLAISLAALATILAGLAFSVQRSFRRS